MVIRFGQSDLVGHDLAKGEQAFDTHFDIDTGGFAMSFKLLPDGERAVAHTLGGGLFIVEMKTGKVLHTLGQATQGKKARAFAAITSKYLVVSVESDAAEVRSLDTFELVKRMPKDKGNLPFIPQVSPAAAVPGTNLILDGTGGGDWKVWNCDTGLPVAVIAPKGMEGHYASKIVFSPDGRMMATGDGRGKIFLWDLSKLPKPAGTAATTPAGTKPPMGIKPPAAPPIAKRTWTSADVKFKVVATLQKIEGANVQLAREDGNVITVPLANLSVADKKYVETVRPQLMP